MNLRLVIALTVALTVHTLAAAPAMELLDRVIAQVNDEFILLSELIEVENEESNSTDARSMPSREELLEKMISARLLEQEARRVGLEPPEEVIAAVVDAKVEELIDSWPDPYTFDQLLANEGMTRATLRDRLREEESRAWMRRTLVMSRIPTPPAEPDFSLQWDLSQIVLACAPEEGDVVDNARRLECLDLRRRALEGDDFAMLATNYSDDPISSPRGGKIGLVDEATIDPAIAEALEGLDEGDVSLPVRTAQGWHLLHVDRVITPRQRWYMQAFDETRDRLLEDIRGRSHIENFLED